MAAWFPDGIHTDSSTYRIVPGGYAVVGERSGSLSVLENPWWGHRVWGSGAPCWQKLGFTTTQKPNPRTVLGGPEGPHRIVRG